MRILQWTELFWPNIGGVEVVMSQLTTSLRQRGHETAVVVSQQSGLSSEDSFHGTPVHRFPLAEALRNHDIEAMITAERRMAAVARAFAPDLLHVMMLGPTMLQALRLAQRLRLPVVTSLQGEVPEAWIASPRTLFAQTLDASAWITACAESVRGQVLARMPHLQPHASVVHYGLDAPADAVVTDADRHPPRLLALGRVVPEKGLDVAIRACARLVQQHPALELTIAGTGPARGALEDLAATTGVASHLRFTGHVPFGSVASLFSSSSLVVMPSRTEGFPRVAVEAAAHARAVVATRVGGLPEAVLDGQTGVLVAPDDDAALAGAVDALLGDRGRLLDLGRAGRRRVLETLTWPRTIDAFEDAYRRALARHSAASSLGRSPDTPAPARADGTAAPSPPRTGLASAPAPTSPRVTPTARRVAFDEAASAFDRAAAIGVPIERAVVVAGRRVRVRIVGEALAARFATAWPHHAEADTNTGACALGIDMWDEAATAVAGPPAPPDLSSSNGGRLVQFATLQAVSRLDRAARRIVAHIPSCERLGAAGLYQPFGPLLAIWLADNDTPAIHAGAIARNGHGIVLTGRAGAGKSTTALTCLLDGWDYLGDDFVAIGRDDGRDGFQVHGVYGMAHVVARHVGQFPGLPVGAVHQPADPAGKAVVDLASAAPDRLVSSATIRAIVLPRIAGPAGETRLRPASRAEAMLMLAPASLFMRGAATPAAFHTMGALIDRVPAYWLDMGPNLSAIPAAIRPLTEIQ